MSASRSTRCLFSAPSPAIRLQCRKFHQSPLLSKRHKPRHASIKAEDMGLIKARKAATEVFKPYNDADKAALTKKYTPAQLEAIAAGEEAISPEDLQNRGVLRTDPGALRYLDDFSQYRSVLDKKPQDTDYRIDPTSRLVNQSEFEDGYVQWLEKIEKLQPAGLKRSDPDYEQKRRPNRADVEFRAPHEVPQSINKDGFETVPLSQFKPDNRGQPTKEEEGLAKLRKVEVEVDERDPDGKYNLLMKKTGYTLDEILDFKVKVLVQHRVVNQTRLGKIASQYVLAVAGNGKGRLGIGQAKGQEALNTLHLAKVAAIYNLRPVPMYEERTIFGEVKGKVSAVEVSLSSRPPGFGLRVQHIIFEMARLCGLKDLAARVPRSRNKMNLVKATYQALMSQRLPDDVARGLGKKLVDVRKVYYSGRV